MALHHHKDANRYGESISSPVQIMILSLFFQLLVFFILMNSISTFTPKADKVMKSMKDSMGGSQSIQMVQGSSLFPLSGTQHGQGTSLDTLGGEFQHEVPGLSAARVKDSGILEMTMAASRFNTMLGGSSAQKMDPRLDHLITYIKTHNNPVYKIVVMGHVRSKLYLRSIENRSLDMSFVSYWAARLRAVGIPPGRIEFGMAPGHPASVTLKVVPIPVNMSASPGTTGPSSLPSKGRDHGF